MVGAVSIADGGTELVLVAREGAAAAAVAVAGAVVAGAVVALMTPDEGGEAAAGAPGVGFLGTVRTINLTRLCLASRPIECISSSHVSHSKPAKKGGEGEKGGNQNRGETEIKNAK